MSAAPPASSVGEPTSVPRVGCSVCRLPDPVSPWPCRRFPGSCAAPTPLPGEPDPVAGVETRSVGEPTPLLLAAVHADPVSRAIDLDAAGRRPREQLGCSFGLGPVNPVPVASGCPATRYPEQVASRSDRTRSRLVDRGPFSFSGHPKATIERLGLSVPVGVRCPVRSHSRGPETPGQAVLSNPQGYPPKYRPIPRIYSRVHRAFTRSCTGCPQSTSEFRCRRV